MNKTFTLFITLLLLVHLSLGGRLTEIRVLSANNKGEIQFIFTPKSEAIPLFFQTYEKKEQTYSIHFLNSASEIPTKTYSLPTNSLNINTINFETIKRKKSNKTRSFLKVSFSPLRSSQATYKASKTNTGEITLSLGSAKGEKFNWILNSASIHKAPAKTNDTIQPTADKKVTQAKTSDTSAQKHPLPMTVLKDSINVRSAPSLSGQKMATATIGSRVLKLGQTKKWTKVDVNGDTGYIFSKLLVKTSKISTQQVAAIEKALLKKKVQADKKAKEKLSNRESQELKQKKEQIQKKYDSHLSEINKEYTDKNRKKQLSQQTAIISIEKNLKRKEQSKKDSLNKILQKLTSKMNVQKEELRTKYNKAIGKIILDSKHEMSGAQKKHNAEIKLMQKELERALQTKKRKVVKSRRVKRREFQTEKERIASRIKKTEEEIYSFRHRYKNKDRRDPFIPLTTESLGDISIRVDRMKLVGIIWDKLDPIAILEDKIEPSLSYAVHKGDRVYQGRVIQIHKDKISFELYNSAGTHIYKLKLESIGNGG